MPLAIHRMVFNAFQVNTYIAYHSDGDAMIVDPACYTSREQEEIDRFITNNNLTVKHIVHTHCHVDHILGTRYACEKFGQSPKMHQAGLPFYQSMVEFANGHGFEVDEPVMPDGYLADGDVLALGDQYIKILYTPGHANGSICLVSEPDKWMITGDLVFYGSIGRTDLPTGSLEVLLASVRKSVLIYPDDFVLYPGHGRQTTVGYERRNNPFL
ncbi:MAG TPA: MBL fold metallo-hydrolase [Bacteroidales bacterium]|nr:MBL fold metallo-hydrolase [Bacteroidales bacterium]HRZ49204.1 MBL fold metallo-hydrolase [Bacteroidales bacterium]